MRRMRRVVGLVVLVAVGLSGPTAHSFTVGDSNSAPASEDRDGAARAEARYRAIVSRLPATTRERMIGSSWRQGCPVPLRKLRLIRLTHWNFHGERAWGKLVVHRRFAADMKRVFSKLFDARFKIRRMHLVDRYDAVDMRSMRHDNTSAFNCRYRNGECCTWSMHAYGKAIDINPVENPYVGSWGVSPPNGAAYADRSKRRKGMIFDHDRVWWAFHRIGWRWGGTWSGAKDYQHFSSNGR